ncbi:MAG: DNA polymerase III subunit delta [Rickettsiales bacterium]|nr:DNA polymerase III subunit delta [Rickettsiales bacterium]
MKITLNNVKKFLDEENFIKFKAILFYGDNSGLIQRYVSSISDKFLANSFAEEQKSLNKIIFNYSPIIKEPDLLLNEMKSINFFGDRKIIIINEVIGNISKQLEQILLERQSTDVLVILYGNKISTKDQIYKVFLSAQDLAAIGCYSEQSSDIKKTIFAKCKDAGMQVESQEVVEHIANNIGGDSAYISAEIDKIISFCDTKNLITLKDVKNIVGGFSSNVGCDKYISFLIEEKFQLAESELKKLILADVKPHFIVRYLSRYFMRLYVAHGLMSEGVHEVDVPRKLTPPVFFKDVPIFKLALKKYSISKITKILECLLKLEIKIKSNDTKFAEMVLEQGLFNLFYIKNKVS